MRSCLFFGRVTAFYLMVIFDFNFLGQGTPSPVNPLAYGMKVCVRAYGASALQFLKHFCRRLGSYRGLPLCRRLLREPECRRPGGLRGAEPPVPYLQCCLCEKPLGCLQSMLRLYLSDHLWRRVRDLFGMWLYIYTKKI